MINSSEIALYVNSLTESNSLESLQHNFKLLCESVFIEHFALVTFRHTNSELEFQIFDTYPNQWIKYYKDEKYYLCDPVFKEFGENQKPYCWGKNRLKGLCPEQEKMFSEAFDRGVRFGLTLPLILSIYEQNFFTVVNQSHLHPEVLYALTHAIQIYKEKQHEIHTQQEILLLTPREGQVLQLKSTGAKAKAIAEKLMIKEETVLYHLKNIKQKMKEPSLEKALYRFGSL